MSLSVQIPPSPSENTAVDSGATTIDTLCRDVLLTHILSRLDGPALASASCSSPTLHSLASHHHRSLWSNICYSTWPSTDVPCLRRIISDFPPNGPHSFFSQSFPLLSTTTATTKKNTHPSSPPGELISAVDIRYRENTIFSKIHSSSDILSEWFLNSPFRLDMLNHKDVVQTSMQHPYNNDTCHKQLSNDLTLSWVLIDPAGKKAVNLSSYKPVSVQRHWLSGEVHVRFASIMAVDQNKDEFVQCGILVTCCGSEGGEMQVREVSLKMEDMDGVHLNGKDSLVILQRALEGKRGKRDVNGEEGKKRYEEFLEKKRERAERKLRIEGVLDHLFVAFVVIIFVLFCLYFAREHIF